MLHADAERGNAMENVIFTISKGIKGINIKTKNRKFNTYNKYELSEQDLFKAMSELADIFNNIIGVGITFDVE